MEICEEANTIEFNKVINTKDYTVISSVIESTTCTSPIHSKDSGATLGKGSVICEFSPPPPFNRTELEKQDDDDDVTIIDL